ncbi:MAG: hypothetical protein IIX19_00480, partial [Alistipes sp.]|nr:hypothetical protein [Alistipes sp.]
RVGPANGHRKGAHAVAGDLQHAAGAAFIHPLCTEAAMYVPGEGWSDWIKVNHSITLNIANDTMIVNGESTVKYKLIDTTGERATADGGVEYVMYGVDQFNEYCTIRAVVNADGSKQMYIEYDMQGTLVYNIK